MNPHANADNNADNDDDVDTTGGRIIVCAEFSIPSQTKMHFNMWPGSKNTYKKINIVQR